MNVNVRAGHNYTSLPLHNCLHTTPTGLSEGVHTFCLSCKPPARNRIRLRGWRQPHSLTSRCHAPHMRPTKTLLHSHVPKTQWYPHPGVCVWSTHRRLAHSQEAQLTSCCRPLAHESSTRQRQYGTMVARAMSRSRVWCDLSEKNHHATGLDTHRPRRLKASQSFPTAACRRRRASCLLGISHVLGGLGCRAAAEEAAPPPAGAPLCGGRQLVAGVAACCGCNAMHSAGRLLRLVLHGWQQRLSQQCWPQGLRWLAALGAAKWLLLLQEAAAQRPTSARVRRRPQALQYVTPSTRRHMGVLSVWQS